MLSNVNTNYCKEKITLFTSLKCLPKGSPYSILDIICKCHSKRSFEKLCTMLLQYSVFNKGHKMQTELPLVVLFLENPKKVACYSEYTSHRATPIIICAGSGCPSGCLGSKGLVSVPHPSRELGTPGGQNGMYRSQEEEDK